MMSESEEELSDYRVVLSCIRKRLQGYGLKEALERLERLDDAILQAILDGAEPPTEPTIN
jgi:hypothetical protein